MRTVVAPSFIQVSFGLVAAATTPAAHWSTTDKNADIQVTTTVLPSDTMGPVTGGGSEGCRSATAITVGQNVYAEFKVKNSGFKVCIGFANVSFPLNQDPGSGADSFSVLSNPGVGTYRNPGSANDGSQAISATTNGDIISMAWNPTANLVWFRKNGLTWMDAVGGGQNPATTTGGFQTVGTSMLYVIGSSFVPGDTIQAYFPSTSWNTGITGGAPSGYTQLAG